MKSENIKLMLLTAIFTAFSCVAQAKSLTARQIYTYAKDSNFDALKTLGNTIDTEDEDGNTALCLALNDGDAKAYRTLQEYGADTTVKCNITYGLSSGDGSYNYYRRGRYYPASRSSGTFLGMGPVGWTVTGVVVAAGAGVAIAAGGGGGGGSSSSSGKKGDDKKPEDDSVTKYLDDEPITDKDKGQEIVGKTVSINSFENETDYLKAANNGTIKKIVSSQSAVSGIVSDSQFTFNAVSLGGNKDADIIVAQRGSGNVYGIKGPKINTLSDDDDDGINVHNAVIGDPENGVATGNVTGNITIRNTGAGTGNLYGMQADAKDVYVVNSQAESQSNSATATGNILIDNINSNKNVYGIYSKADAMNTETSGNAKAYGNITINNSGNGNVLGIQTSKYNTANAGAVENSKATASITINNSGSGDVYGINTDEVSSDRFLLNAVATNSAVANGNITIRNTGAGTGNIYGLRAKGDTYVGNAVGIQELWDDDYEMDSSTSVATGNISVENINSNKNVYGIYAKADSVNAESNDNDKAYGYIAIKNSGNGNVYGIQTSKDNTRNAGATENSEATAVIDINNTGNGNVYGMNEDKNYPDGDLYNAQGGERKSHEGDYKEDYPAKATAIINIENTGTGNAYGIKSLTNTYNAHSYYNSTATGKIRVSNNGKGNAYGIYGNHVIKNASAHSEGSDYYATAKGYVNILNKSSGNAYGLYSNNPGNLVMNNNGDDGETQISVIELANIGNGLVVGMYSKDGSIENSGDIKIHNLAEGKAVGIYADGTTTVENSGNITIDRTNYKDDKATDTTSDDVTYKKKSDKGGKAIGIYGANGTNIINSGTIKINDAKEAYGIYAEGTNVTNTGTIIIDGDNNHKNAIKLNGGKLLQDGVIKVGSDWDDIDPCDDVTCGANATCSVGVCKCNSGYQGDADKGCTKIEQGQIIGRSIVGTKQAETWEDEEGEHKEYYYSAKNNQNINISKNSGKTVIGLQAKSMDIYNAYSAKVTINATQEGNGGVYGIKAVHYDQDDMDNNYYVDVENAYVEGSGTASANIFVTNKGNGSAYGIVYANTPNIQGYIANARAEADTEIAGSKNADASVKGIISINNSGNGNVYGMKANYISNADASTYIDRDDANVKAEAVGKIRIANGGTGDAYGIYSPEGSAHNASGSSYISEGLYDVSSQVSTRGYIYMINLGSGNAYAMRAQDVYNKYNDEAKSFIEIANVGSGLAVGVYSKNGRIENSGPIKIHNLANGTAVGIYADGTTYVTNSGTITIDRSSYTDDKATETTSDDVTYKKKSDKGGKAVGIYGAAGSYIDNSGTIKINGASTAYGIYTEGGSVRNTGTILIDGNSNHANAIRLNGGKLFQNGKIVAGADWNNNGTSGGQNEDDEEDLTDIDTGNTIIKKSLTQAYDVENVGVAGNNAYIKAVVDSRSAVIGINAPDDIEAGNAVGISTNKTASIDITQYGTGDVYGMRHRDLSGRGEPQDEDDYMDMYNAVGYNATGTIKIKDTGGKIVINDADDNGNIYGMYSNAVYMDLSNALVADDSSSSHTVRGTIEITAYGDNHVHGIYSQGEAVNAEGDSQGLAIGNINITNNGDGEVYGIETRRILYNAEATDTSNAEAIVTINNNGTGEGNVYGLFSVLDDVYNAKAGHEREPYKMQDAATAVGTVDIDNKSNGDVYGIHADQFAYNAYAYADSEATGTIGIKNKRNGDVTAIYAHSAANAWVGNNGNATGLIKIINNGNGVVKGMAGSSMKNARADTPGLATATIDIENYGTNDVYGIQGHYVVNARSEGHTEDDSRSIVADGKIIITNQNGGNVYGLDGGDDNIGVYNATASEKNAQNTGLIKINNQGNGNVYAMNLSEGEHENIRMQNASISEHGRAVGRIEIVNNGWGDVYGIRNAATKKYGDTIANAIAGSSYEYSESESLDETGYAEGSISIQNTGNGEVVGIHSGDVIYNAKTDGAYTTKGNISIINRGNGDVYGMRGFLAVNATAIDDNSTVTGSITINNIGDGNVYGLFGSKSVGNSLSELTISSFDRGIISIDNNGHGDVYGMHSDLIDDEYHSFNAIASMGAQTSGRIRISNRGNGSTYGISGHGVTTASAKGASSYSAVATSTIDILNLANGNAYGLYSNTKGNNIHNQNIQSTTGDASHATSVIEMANVSDGSAVGIYSKNGTIENSGDIKIHNLAGGKAVGIYADGTTSVLNSGRITIDRASYTDDMATDTTSDDVTYTKKSNTGGTAVGIYGAAGSSIVNSGTININNASTAYGIYAENGAMVENTGTIKIDGNSGHSNRIVLNGSSLFQNGILSVTMSSATPAMSSVSDITPQVASLNLNDFGGTVVASDTSQFIVEGAISGDLAINNSVVENGFDTVYKVSGMIDAADTNGLNLYSQSALFDAALENDTDAVMTMRSFDSVVENSSVADFLQNNYASSNNEDLFKALKSAETVAELNSSIDDLFGKDMLSSMAFEDLSMLREVSFDMNNRLFEKEGSFALGESISPSGYDNKLGSVGRYSLNGFNNGKTSFGLGISITDVRTTEGKKDNRRFDRSFMMSMPVGHKTHGFELISTPKLGYTHGTYERKGLNNMTYEGRIQKRTVALMNEARYPLDFWGIRLFPSTEFNMIGYNLKGHEDDRQYALRMRSQNHYSVEAGLGLMAQKEFKPYKDHKFNVKGGVAVYHEFGNPYELEVGMSGMDGHYKLQDEKRGDNRTVVRFGFDYSLKDNMNVSANWLTNIDREYRTGANIDLKYNF